MQGSRGLAFPDWRAPHEQHRSRVESGVHLHDGDARLEVARLDRARDRRRAAPARQQRRVDVEATEARYLEHRRRQDEAVSDDHHQVRLVAAQAHERFFRPKRRRLLQRDAQRHRALLDRPRSDHASATGGTVGLRIHRSHPMTRRVQGIERRHRERRRPRKHDGKMARSQFRSIGKWLGAIFPIMAQIDGSTGKKIGSEPILR